MWAHLLAACDSLCVYIRLTSEYVSAMASLTTPLSVRLTEEDTSFLGRLEIDGALTASDKIRGLIRQARHKADQPDSFSGALALSHDQLAGAVRAIRVAEQETGEHSDVVIGLMTAVEEFLALALVTPRTNAKTGRDALVRHEARLVDCAARMTEQLLRWAVTPTAPAYDTGVVARRLAALGDLMQLTVAARTAR